MCHRVGKEVFVIVACLNPSERATLISHTVESTAQLVGHFEHLLPSRKCCFAGAFLKINTVLLRGRKARMNYSGRAVIVLIQCTTALLGYCIDSNSLVGLVTRQTLA
jgi:hypothetical protein